VSSHQNSTEHQICCRNNTLTFIAALKACAVECTVYDGFPSIVTQLYKESEAGKFANLAI